MGTKTRRGHCWAQGKVLGCDGNSHKGAGDDAGDWQSRARLGENEAQNSLSCSGKRCNFSWSKSIV